MCNLKGLNNTTLLTRADSRSSLFGMGFILIVLSLGSAGIWNAQNTLNPLAIVSAIICVAAFLGGAVCIGAEIILTIRNGGTPPKRGE